jgi:hypothetical protein
MPVGVADEATAQQDATQSTFGPRRVRHDCADPFSLRLDSRPAAPGEHYGPHAAGHPILARVRRCFAVTPPPRTNPAGRRARALHDQRRAPPNPSPAPFVTLAALRASRLALLGVYGPSQRAKQGRTRLRPGGTARYRHLVGPALLCSFARSTKWPHTWDTPRRRTDARAPAGPFDFP